MQNVCKEENVLGENQIVMKQKNLLMKGELGDSQKGENYLYITGTRPPINLNQNNVL